jgi:hypothetical protein
MDIECDSKVVSPGGGQELGKILLQLLLLDFQEVDRGFGDASAAGAAAWPCFLALGSTSDLGRRATKVYDRRRQRGSGQSGGSSSSPHRPGNPKRQRDPALREGANGDGGATDGDDCR